VACHLTTFVEAVHGIWTRVIKEIVHNFKIFYKCRLYR